MSDNLVDYDKSIIASLLDTYLGSIIGQETRNLFAEVNEKLHEEYTNGKMFFEWDVSFQNFKGSEVNVELLQLGQKPNLEFKDQKLLSQFLLLNL